MTEPGVPARSRISVVICAYTEDRWGDLVEAVESVQAQAGCVDLETIVVIDHNPSLLERAGRSLAGVRVTENVEGRGLSGARNSGVALATGDVVAFMDDDAVAAIVAIPGTLLGTAIGPKYEPPPEYNATVTLTIEQPQHVELAGGVEGTGV